MDVIEHIADAGKFLANIKEKFPNLKNIIITVPARQEIFSNYDEFNNHFLRYDFKTLESHCTPLMFKKIEMSYFFHSLYLPAWFLKKSAKKRNTTIEPPKGFAKVLHQFLSACFFMEYKILPSRLIGTSIIADVTLK
ncbi:MAG: hypothetical protein H0X62_13570 [Bacteroidetes bacterium]|nr:hypothetical protein [Bacteroidota bacterium]